jgi:hypothetical protein
MFSSRKKELMETASPSGVYGNENVFLYFAQREPKYENVQIKKNFPSKCLQDRYLPYFHDIVFFLFVADLYFSVLGIRDILVRIRIPESVPLTNGSGSGSVSFLH